jgi:flagellar hook-associated protein 1 FlgK
MASGILGTALTGLMAFQRAMQTGSNNVANVNTDGYSRQSTNLESATTTFDRGNYIGNGVDVSNVSRSYDQFINNNIRTSASSLGDADRLQTMTKQVDNLMANPETGMSNAMKSFFKAANGVATDPTSVPARTIMVSEISSLATQFNTVSSQLDNFRAQNNALMQTNIDNINSYTQNISNLNIKISAVTRGGGTQFPNELLDQRDQLLAKLSENIDTSILVRSDGAVDVFIGQGQALISGNSHMTLALSNSTTDVMQKRVVMKAKATDSDGLDVSNQFSSGSLAGSMKFRDQVLDPAQQQLGLVAAGLAKLTNEIHEQGVDLKGNVGKAMFSFQPTEVMVYSNLGNPSGAVNVTIDTATVNNLQASDYRLDYNLGAYSLTRLSDNMKVSLPSGGLPTTVDGMTITEMEIPSGTSSFIIRPTYSTAANIRAAITAPDEIAAAQSNSNGDNTNALALTKLETQSTLTNSKTFGQTYEQLVAKVGSSTNAATVSLSAQKALYNTSIEARANFAGVNLDEEAANLIKFQNAYQASSQVVAISRALFDSLIAAVR